MRFAAGVAFVVLMLAVGGGRVAAATGDITTVIGGVPSDGVPATQAHLAGPWGVGVNSAGDFAIADYRGSLIFKVAAATGTIHHVVGTGMNARSIGWSGLDGPTADMVIDAPEEAGIDGAGNVYFYYNGGKILKTDGTGNASVVVNGGANGIFHVDNAGDVYFRSGNGIKELDSTTGAIHALLRSAYLGVPAGLAMDAAGNLYLADEWDFVVLKITPSGQVTKIAGNRQRGQGQGTFSGDGGPAVDAGFSLVRDVDVDAAGNIYILDNGNHRIRKVDTATGIVTTIAGNGTQGNSGDGGPATDAEFGSISTIALDSAGNLYLADETNSLIRKVNASTGVISTIAGQGDVQDGNTDASNLKISGAAIATDRSDNLYIAAPSSQVIFKVDAQTNKATIVAGTLFKAGFSGDGGPATEAEFDNPKRVRVDAAGNLYITDNNNERIRKVDAATGIVTTIAGNGDTGYNGDGPATEASLNMPYGGDLAIDAAGNLYITDQTNNILRKVDAKTGAIQTLLGNETGWSYRSAVDGRLASGVEIKGIQDVSADANGNVYIAESSTNRVWKIDSATGIIRSIAGTGQSGYSGDGGPATQASLNLPRGVAVDSDGNVYIADASNHRIRKVDASGVITTFAGGDATSGALATLWPPSSEGGPATEAWLNFPTGVDVDGAGNVYFTDREMGLVYKVDASGTLTAVAGGGVGDGGPAVDAGVSGWLPSFFVDGSGDFYLNDSHNHRIREVNAQTGDIATVVGNGVHEAEPSPDGGLATGTAIDAGGITAAADGTIYFTGGGRLRKVDAQTGVVTTVAGGGDLTGAGVPADSAWIGDGQVVMDATGNFYVAAATEVQKIDASGMVTVVAGNRTAGYSGDGGPATEANFNAISDLFLDGNGNLYIADRGNQRVRKVDGSGVVTTVAGNGTAGFSGDGGPATDAQINQPYGIFVDSAGNLFIADEGNSRVRKVDGQTGVITTVAGNGKPFYSGDGGPATDAATWVPLKVFGDPSGNLYVGLWAVGRIVRVEGIAAPTTVGKGVFKGPEYPPLAKTTAGANVAVQPTDPASGTSVSLTFSNVTGSGETSLTTSTDGPPPPSGFQLGDPPLYLDLNTSAAFSGAVEVCVDYSGLNVVQEDSLKLLHYVDNAWVDATTSLDTAKKTICGSATSFSPFTLAEPQPKVSKNLVVVDATVTNGGTPLAGVEVAFSRSIAGKAPDYKWQGVTDADGKVEVHILTTDPQFWRVGASGYYVIQATQGGQVVGEWGSIPLNGNQKVALHLPVGEPAEVMNVESLSSSSSTLALVENYPNPFNPATQIAYDLPEAGQVRLTIYNALGQQVRVLVDQQQAAGRYRIRWDGRDATGRQVSSGIYLYRLAVDGGKFTATRRMLLLK